ncbi:MAG TPA: hypothetical protein VFK34_11680 [Marmoricola sp.]|nr:hypothetical protein [Marmoricola sp.]
MSTQLEKDLGRALDERAAGMTGGLDLAEVRARAVDLRRQTRRRWATGLAAAAVVVVAVPAALLLPGHEDAGPVTPSPTPTVAPDKLPDPSPDATQQNVLEGLPVGAAPNWPYLLGTTVHLPDGSTVALPGAAKDSDLADVGGFVSYRGGWLVADSGMRMTRYDSSGGVVAQGEGNSIVTSSDGTRVAYLLGGKAFVGSRSGMSEGEQELAGDTGGEGLVGLVRDGAVYVPGAGAVRLMRYDGTVGSIDDVYIATATSDSANLVGGYVDEHTGGVVDLDTGTVLWREGWRALSFSPDGRLLAAVPMDDNGEPSELAMLDARTGATVARAPLVDNGIQLNGAPVWEDETHLLFVADSGPSPHQAILRMGTESGLERATPAVAGGSETGMERYHLAAGR